MIGADGGGASQASRELRITENLTLCSLPLKLRFKAMKTIATSDSHRVVFQ